MAALGQCDPVLAHKQARVPHSAQRFRELQRGWSFRIGLLRRKVIRTKLPQRLHRQIEGVGRSRGKMQRSLQQCHHVRVGRNQNAGAIEGGDHRVGQVQAELLLQPPHVEDTSLHNPLGLGPVGTVDLDRDLRAECRPLPPHHLACPSRPAISQ
jgi:hypothetical protein